AAAAGGTTRPYECLQADANADYVSSADVDLGALEPVVARPPDPAGVVTVRDCADVKLDRAYIGSCTGGKISDFDAFAQIVRGKRVTI
ncbi:MAG: 3-isopropylmalate dehydratase, partial [Verrucomicrobiota bacterium]|nr:3-isopropylmalate dehydratase [Verrucomicrobiota bacterium]